MPSKLSQFVFDHLIKIELASGLVAILGLIMQASNINVGIIFTLIGFNAIAIAYLFIPQVYKSNESVTKYQQFLYNLIYWGSAVQLFCIYSKIELVEKYKMFESMGISTFSLIIIFSFYFYFSQREKSFINRTLLMRIIVIGILLITSKFLTFDFINKTFHNGTKTDYYQLQE